MSDFTLIVGNKNYSSWSLRGWLMVKQSGAEFDETVIRLNQPGTAAAIRTHSAAGRVPILKHGGGTVWDTLAIAEFLAERFPQAALWPADRDDRARARSISAEMHSGFAALRQFLPMDLRTTTPNSKWNVEVDDDIARIIDIWKECRDRAPDGPFLFGAYCSAGMWSWSECASITVRLRHIDYIFFEPQSRAHPLGHVSLPRSEAFFEEQIQAFHGLRTVKDAYVSVVECSNACCLLLRLQARLARHADSAVTGDSRRAVHLEPEHHVEIDLLW